MGGVSADTGKPDLSSLCLDAYARLARLVAELDAAALATPVPACPGCPAWSVRDVLAHEIAITEDSPTGRMTGLPSEEETAAQVARFKGRDIADMLATWAQNAPRFAEVVAAFEVCGPRTG